MLSVNELHGAAVYVDSHRYCKSNNYTDDMFWSLTHGDKKHPEQFDAPIAPYAG
jgi:hypothetical protein